jgi:hypothetical protein
MAVRLASFIVGLMAIGVAFLFAAPSKPSLAHYNDHSASAHVQAELDHTPVPAGVHHRHHAELLQESSGAPHHDEHCPPCYEAGPGLLKAKTWTRDSDKPVKKSPDAAFVQLASASSRSQGFEKLSLQRFSAPPIHADIILRTGRLRI